MINKLYAVTQTRQRAIRMHSLGPRPRAAYADHRGARPTLLQSLTRRRMHPPPSLSPQHAVPRGTVTGTPSILLHVANAQTRNVNTRRASLTTTTTNVYYYILRVHFIIRSLFNMQTSSSSSPSPSPSPPSSQSQSSVAQLLWDREPRRRASEGSSRLSRVVVVRRYDGAAAARPAPSRRDSDSDEPVGHPADDR